jgi:hypothetical protein
MRRQREIIFQGSTPRHQILLASNSRNPLLVAVALSFLEAFSKTGQCLFVVLAVVFSCEGLQRAELRSVNPQVPASSPGRGAKILDAARSDAGRFFLLRDSGKFP